MKKLLPFLFIAALLATPTAYAGNTNATHLTKASSQTWKLPNASLGGVKIAAATDMSICGTFKLTTDTDVVVETWGVSGGPSNDYQFRMYYQPGHLMIFNIDSGNVSVAFTPSTATKYRACVTYKQSTGATNFYINGAQQGTTQTLGTGGPNGNAGDLWVGSDVGTASLEDGDFDNLKIWSRELSASDITSDNSNACTYTGANLLIQSLFDNNGNDSSGNGHTLTNINSATFVSGLDTCTSASAPTSIIGLVRAAWFH